MEALKRVASDFADERPNDRIGLVVMRLKPTKHRLPAIKWLEAIKSIKYDNVFGMGLE
jgi:Ca-activated chloride channel family protein